MTDQKKCPRGRCRDEERGASRRNKIPSRLQGISAYYVWDIGPGAGWRIVGRSVNDPVVPYLLFTANIIALHIHRNILYGLPGYGRWQQHAGIEY